LICEANDTWNKKRVEGAKTFLDKPFDGIFGMTKTKECGSRVEIDGSHFNTMDTKDKTLIQTTNTKTPSKPDFLISEIMEKIEDESFVHMDDQDFLVKCIK
jgi:hypothetical protein